jgi:hypothetical protein
MWKEHEAAVVRAELREALHNRRCLLHKMLNCNGLPCTVCARYCDIQNHHRTISHNVSLMKSTNLGTYCDKLIALANVNAMVLPDKCKPSGCD